MNKLLEFVKAKWEDGLYAEELAIWLRSDIEEKELMRWKNGMPKEYGYTTFEIPKRNKKGMRKIEAPSENLKKLQRAVYEAVFWNRPNQRIHERATGFKHKNSIVDAARHHTNKSVVINLDLKDFFHSTTKERLEKHFRKMGWGRSATKILSNICCYQNGLPVGSPVSPMLTNLVNYPMDVRLDKLAKKFGGDYSRYADDITFSFEKFSGKEKLVIKLAREILAEYGYQIQMKKKIRVQRSHQKQTVTGLVVNKTINLDRKLRRQIRALEHKNKLGLLNTEKQNVLKGYRALMLMVEKQK